MAERTSSSEPVAGARPAGIDEQLWPIVCATMVLVGILGVIVCVNSDFDEDRLFLNGYTHLAGLAVAAALLIFIASRLKGAARRTAELAIVLSLALHAAAGVGAFYLFTSPLSGSTSLDAARDARPESDDESPPPDYHWAQDDEQQPEQAFEKVVATTIREQAPPAAQVQPRNMERPAPAAEIPRAPNVEVTPLGVGRAAEPSGPLDIRRPDAAKIEEAKPPEALAMVRQKADELPLPKTESPAPVAMPEAPKEPPKPPSPPPVDKRTRSTGPPWPKKAAAPNNEPPRRRTRWRASKSSRANRCPRRTLSPGFPRRPRRKLPTPRPGPKRPTGSRSKAARWSDPIAMALPLPSTVIPDAGLPAQSPGRWRQFSAQPVGGRFDRPGGEVGYFAGPARSHDCLGRRPRISAADPRSCHRGGARSTAAARPCLRSKATRPRTPRNSAPGPPVRTSARGLPLPSAPARRAIASQTEDGGSGPSASQAARLPRTQSEMGLDLPAAAKIAENAALPGAGGTASNPGGQTSTLDVGQRISIRRSARQRRAARQPAESPRRPQRVGDVLAGNDTSRRRRAAAVGQVDRRAAPHRARNSRGRRQRHRQRSPCPLGGLRSARPAALPSDPLPVRRREQRAWGRQPAAGLWRCGPWTQRGAWRHRAAGRRRPRRRLRPSSQSSRRKSPAQSASRRRSRRGPSATAARRRDSWIKSSRRWTGHRPYRSRQQPGRASAARSTSRWSLSAAAPAWRPGDRRFLRRTTHRAGHRKRLGLLLAHAVQRRALEPSPVARRAWPRDPASLGTLHADTAATGLALF